MTKELTPEQEAFAEKWGPSLDHGAYAAYHRDFRAAVNAAQATTISFHCPKCNRRHADTPRRWTENTAYLCGCGNQWQPPELDFTPATITGKEAPAFLMNARDNSKCKFASGGARCVSHCGDPVCLATPQRDPAPEATHAGRATPGWWQAKMLAAAASTGDEGTIKLAAQLAGCLPCPDCDFVKSACRCTQADPAPAPLVAIRCCPAHEGKPMTMTATAWVPARYACPGCEPALFPNLKMGSAA